MSAGLATRVTTQDPGAEPAAATASSAAPVQRSALRLLTAGSVDDGKSTLIGRLLYDSRAILADQVEQLQQRAVGQPAQASAPGFDLAQLTDGLQAEREQGITIDVAWRYFATPRRKFILADAPGHEQYTRNMVTAAAGSDAAVVLVDVTKLDLAASGVALLPQTRRHALLAHLLRVPSIVFAVNKLDAVGDPEAAFASVRLALQHFAAQAGLAVAGIVPISALRGDNVSQQQPLAGHVGPSLLGLLEELPSTRESLDAPWALPVQYVQLSTGTLSPAARVLWGRVAQGRLRLGDRVQVFPSGEQARVTALRGTQGDVAEVTAGRSAGVVLDRALDVSRGDWLAAPGQALGQAAGARRVHTTLAWLDTEPAMPGRKYLLRHGHRWVQARLAQIDHRLDIHSLQRQPAQSLGVNDIGEVHFELQQPLPLQPYADNRVAGALIVVDPASHRTSGAALVLSSAA